MPGVKWILAIVLVAACRRSAEPPTTTTTTIEHVAPLDAEPEEDEEMVLPPDREQEHPERDAFERGESLFEQGRYAEAAEAFLEAWHGAPMPQFLYNAATCYRLIGDGPQAITYYEAYLRADPDAPNKVKVEAIIQQLSGP
jgi:tetratricopeptide (TPR) repeat protein